MEKGIIIIGGLIGFIAILCGIYVSFTARKKGPILSNTYLLLSKEERKHIDKSKEYKLVTVVFSCISAIFAFITIYVLTLMNWALLFMWIVIIFVCIYAIMEAIKTKKKE